MNQDNTSTLYERYPRLYQGKSLSFLGNRMAEGFACGDGWFALIDRLSSKIELECERLRLQEEWPEAQLPFAVQVKEKMGALRFYMRTRTQFLGYGSEIIKSLIEMAIVESEQTCEECGCPGMRRLGVGLQTLCDTCCQEVESSILGRSI